MIRKRTIVPVADPRSMSLGARILHFKIAPHELQAVLKREDARKLRHITDHGTNLVARNKQLAKPPSNQVERFEVERRRQEEAKARMQAHHRVMADVLAAGVNRWGARKQQAALLRARQHWARKTLLLVALGKITHKLHALYRVRCRAICGLVWAIAKQNVCMSGVGGAYLVQPATPGYKANPALLETQVASHLLKPRHARYVGDSKVLDEMGAQKSIAPSTAGGARDHHVHRRAAGSQVSSGMKNVFCILKYRHCIQVFQSMWRGWMSITDARVKLLLLFWAKLERKALDKGATSDDVSKLSLVHTVCVATSNDKIDYIDDHAFYHDMPGGQRAVSTPDKATLWLTIDTNTVATAGHTVGVADWHGGYSQAARALELVKASVAHRLKTSLVKDLLRKKRQEFLALRQEQKELCENQLELRRRRGVGMDARTVLALDNLRFEKSQFLMLQSISEADMLGAYEPTADQGSRNPGKTAGSERTGGYPASGRAIARTSLACVGYCLEVGAAGPPSLHCCSLLIIEI
ncbi:hypothetical protein AaE_001564, partial [Aphanomyces astaci]